VAYEKLRNPFVINDLDLQYFIQDRCALTTAIRTSVMVMYSEPCSGENIMPLLIFLT